MKLTQKITALVAISFVATAHAQNETVKLAYVHETSLTEKLLAGKLTPDTIFWANEAHNPEMKPLQKEEDGVKFLRVYPASKEAKVSAEEKTQSRTKIVRVFDVPEGKKEVLLTLDIRAAYDAWGDPSPGAAPVKGSLIRISSSPEPETLNYPLVLPQRHDAAWRKATTILGVPAGTKQVAVEIESNATVKVDIASIQAEFR
jgi:hypothetical protein